MSSNFSHKILEGFVIIWDKRVWLKDGWLSWCWQIYWHLLFLLLKILFQGNQISNRLSNRRNKYIFHGLCGETLWSLEIPHGDQKEVTFEELRPRQKDPCKQEIKNVWCRELQRDRIYVVWSGKSLCSRANLMRKMNTSFQHVTVAIKPGSFGGYQGRHQENT